MDESIIKTITQLGGFGLVVAINVWLMFIAFPKMTKRFDAMLDRSDIQKDQFIKALAEQNTHCNHHNEVLEGKVDGLIAALKVNK